MSRPVKSDTVLSVKKEGLYNESTGKFIEWGHVEEIADELSDAHFAKLYYEMLYRDKVRLSELESLLLWKFSMKVKYNDMAFIFTTIDKDKFREENNCSLKVINDSIRKMIDKQIVYKGKRQGLYYMNPKYIAKGNSSSIIKLKYALVRVAGTTYKITEYGLKENY